METTSVNQIEDDAAVCADDIPFGADEDTVATKRKQKRQRNPDAFLLSAEEVGYMIGMQEVDVRMLMKKGVLRAYRVKSRLKTTREDVLDFLRNLRQDGVGLKNIIVPHVPTPEIVAQDRKSNNEPSGQQPSARKTNQSKGAKHASAPGYLVLKQRGRPGKRSTSPIKQMQTLETAPATTVIPEHTQSNQPIT